MVSDNLCENPMEFKTESGQMETELHVALYFQKFRYHIFKLKKSNFFPGCS
jgi:hypothetical protein